MQPIVVHITESNKSNPKEVTMYIVHEVQDAAT